MARRDQLVGVHDSLQAEKEKLEQAVNSALQRAEDRLMRTRAENAVLQADNAELRSLAEEARLIKERNRRMKLEQRELDKQKTKIASKAELLRPRHVRTVPGYAMESPSPVYSEHMLMAFGGCRSGRSS